MAEAIPPPAPPPLPIPPAASPAPVASVPAPPPSLMQLPLGSRLVVTVDASPPATGSVRVSGATGTFTLQSPLPLPPGSSLLLQVQSRVPFLLQFLAIDGRAPGTAGIAARGPAAPLANVPPPAGAAISTLAVGSSLTALLSPTNTPGQSPGLSAGPSVSASGAAGAGASAGAAAASRGVASAASASMGTGALTGGPPGAPSVATPGAGAETLRGVQDYARQAARVVPAQGSRFGVQVTAIRPPLTSGPPPAPASSPIALGATLTGTTAGTTAAGQPVLLTSAGTVVLLTDAAVPRDSTVTLLVTSAPAARPAPAAQVSEMLGRLQDWPALRDAMAALHQVEPGAARMAVETVLPRPDATLTAGLLLFLSAVNGGSLRGWLGDGVLRALQRTRPDLAAQMGEEFRQLTRPAEDGGGNWRAYLLPFHNGTDIEPIRLFVRQRAAGDDDSTETGNRFVVDIRLTRIGRFQVDGLVRERSRRFDLIIRSEERLPPWMQVDIRGLFEGALDATGQKGGIAFRADPAGFADPRVVTEDSASVTVI